MLKERLREQRAPHLRQQVGPRASYLPACAPLVRHVPRAKQGDSGNGGRPHHPAQTKRGFALWRQPGNSEGAKAFLEPEELARAV